MLRNRLCGAGTLRGVDNDECCTRAEVDCDCGPPVVGGVVVVRLHVKDADCEPVDAAVVFRMRLPDGQTISPSAAHDALGEYSVTYAVVDAGQHWWRFEIGGPVDMVVEGAFLAAASNVLV